LILTLRFSNFRINSNPIRVFRFHFVLCFLAQEKYQKCL